MDFENLFLRRESSNAIIKSNKLTLYQSIFGGSVHSMQIESRYRHFITFSKQCFSDNPAQQNLSIFVDPDSDLPEWKGIVTKEDFLPHSAVQHFIDFSQNQPKTNGTKIGGNPAFIRAAQADLLRPVLQKNNAHFVLQLDEEDCFFTSQPGIDKVLRDILCGGVLYIFAQIKDQENLIDFDSCFFDHQM